MDIQDKRWIEKYLKESNEYQMICPACGFQYTPKSYEDGTIEKPYHFCPHCGNSIDWSKE